MDTNDTIFALATAPGRAGVAVFRISGPAAAAALTTVTGLKTLPSARRAIRCRMVEPLSGEVLDDGLAIWFSAPASFTGEDVAELHVHGGRATVDAVASVLGSLPAMRIAEPGEFTKRAFLSGKIDLTAAEAIADLVDADTDAQRRQALAQLGGGLSTLLEAWRTELVDILAHGEAWIDFPEEDLPAEIEGSSKARVNQLAGEIKFFLDDNRRGERLREGLYVAILGAPNAGKSSLLNALAAREVSIVSDTEGTTRDVIEVHLDLGGWPVTLADTAGLRKTGDTVEQEGVRRALDRADRADLRLILFDSTIAPDRTSLDFLTRPNSLAVLTKIDLGEKNETGVLLKGAVSVSMKSGEGLSNLLGQLEERAAGLMDGAGDNAPLTRLRHRIALSECVDALTRAAATHEAELFVEDLRFAARALGRVTGRVDIEDLLDVIFSDFCIGK